MANINSFKKCPTEYDQRRSREMFSSAKRDAIKAARDLGYGDMTIELLRKAETITGITNIMKTARKEHIEECT